MKTYLVTFTPAEPYFFGNEKTFGFDAKSRNLYYVESEDMPSQSTLLGALRYILLPVKKQDYKYTDEERRLNADAVGQYSFNIEKNWTFGKIKSISPVFLYNNSTNERFIPVPQNHISTKKLYSPFKEKNTAKTSEGEKYYFEDYNPKVGLSDGFLCLNDELTVFDRGEIVNSCERVGINRSEDNNGFFKKLYKELKKNYSFAVYFQTDGEIKEKETVVCLGQGKSPFAVRFVEEENNMEKVIKDKLSLRFKNEGTDYDMVYCFGDAFVDDNPCADTCFSAFITRDYRTYSTGFDASVKKGECLYRLIKSGGVFIANNSDKWIEKHKNENAEIIGFNKFIVIGGKNNES